LQTLSRCSCWAAAVWRQIQVLGEKFEGAPSHRLPHKERDIALAGYGTGWFEHRRVQCEDHDLDEPVEEEIADAYDAREAKDVQREVAKEGRVDVEDKK
jgi:hypothetical protein